MATDNEVVLPVDPKKGGFLFKIKYIDSVFHLLNIS